MSMFVAVPATGQSADPVPDYLATFDACPEDVIPDSSFTDVRSNHPNAGDIDCIAYYGITLGKTATTYAPDDPVIREHMALFLVRLARLVGIRIPPPTETPFQDIAHLKSTSRDAISQIYDLGITIGATTTTYAPSRNVSRGEMARFLQKLMDLMEPVRDGRDSYGYLPEDVKDNRERFPIGSPFLDLEDLNVRMYDAVNHLYELGVAAGLDGSDRFFRPQTDMSRAAMAEFMAGILDHSNLRPKGVTVQVAPKTGLDNFDITMTISVRNELFIPTDGQPVDWFYTDDSEGGLDRGECEVDLIQPDSADCTWEDTDDTTGSDGNIFVRRIEATAGETMTFYAWVGREGEDFDAEVVTYSTVEAHSTEGADSISVTWHDRDILPDAYKLNEAYLVERDVDSIDFTIQLLDEAGEEVRMEGVEIEVEVDSTDGAVTGGDAGAVQPTLVFEELGGEDVDEETVVTDRNGEAVFELEGPGRRDRLDLLTFNPDCQDCASKTVDILWSGGDPVLMSARPQFDTLKIRPSGSTLSFTVDYRIFDQYGNSVSSTTGSRSGRAGTTVRGKLAYGLYSVETVDSDGASSVTAVEALESATAKDMTFSRGRFVGSVSATFVNSVSHKGLFLVLKPTVFSDADDDMVLDTDTEVRYVEDPVVVWFVSRASKSADLPKMCDLTDTSSASVDLPALEVYKEINQFRTCFTLWSYDTREDLFRVGDENVTIDEFEEALDRKAKDAGVTNPLADLTISLYSASRGGISFFKLS
jgi:hypothetical protein